MYVVTPVSLAVIHLTGVFGGDCQGMWVTQDAVQLPVQNGLLAVGEARSGDKDEGTVMVRHSPTV